MHIASAIATLECVSRKDVWKGGREKGATIEVPLAFVSFAFKRNFNFLKISFQLKLRLN